MEQGNAIEVKAVKKRFKVYFDKGMSLKEKILFRKRNRYEERWVLKGISFQVASGEAIGLVGRNGCGKSTTLKMLTRIMYPTEGTIEVNGRVSSIIELGAGFHPDLSGRENIYTNASIFGLNHREIDDRIQDIIEFSELEEYIDNPVRTYSSGMYMRLAFSVAINVDADILLIDEILGVGDVSFQMKCFDKLKDIKEKGTTIVIVSHSLEQIEKICDRSIWIDSGYIMEEGSPETVHGIYLSHMEKERQLKCEQEQQYVDTNDNVPVLPLHCSNRAVRTGNQKVSFVSVNMHKSNDKAITSIFKTEEDICITMEYNSEFDDLQGYMGFEIRNMDGIGCCSGNSMQEGKSIKLKKQDKIQLFIQRNQLLSGKYVLDLMIFQDEATVYDKIDCALEFELIDDRKEKEIYRLWYEWKSDAE